MSFRVLAPLALLAAAACTDGGDGGDGGGGPAATASADAGGATASATSSAAAGGAKAIKEDSDLYSFAYAYPAEAGAIPALAARLDGDLEARKAELAGEAAEGQADAESNGFPYNPHYFSENWQVVADLPGWLSLTGDFSTYSGGAHGNYGRESLVWDKAAGRGFPAIAMFESADALGAALGERLCEALDRERGKRRGEPVAAGSEEMFDECLSIADAVLVAGSSNRKTFNRIGVWFGPYAAGPYAEGAYELTFPVDAAILATVKPAYRPAFSAAR
jgi:hypothetical protein